MFMGWQVREIENSGSQELRAQIGVYSVTSVATEGQQEIFVVMEIFGSLSRLYPGCDTAPWICKTLPFRGNWVKGICDLSVWFLITAWESIIT